MKITQKALEFVTLELYVSAHNTLPKYLYFCHIIIVLHIKEIFMLKLVSQEGITYSNVVQFLLADLTF